MVRTFALVALGVTLTCGGCPKQQPADTASSGTTEPTAPGAALDLLVKPTPGIAEGSLGSALATVGADRSIRPSVAGWYLATFPETEPPRTEQQRAALLGLVRDLPEVADVQPNRTHTAQ